MSSLEAEVTGGQLGRVIRGHPLDPLTAGAVWSPSLPIRDEPACWVKVGKKSPEDAGDFFSRKGCLEFYLSPGVGPKQKYGA